MQLNHSSLVIGVYQLYLLQALRFLETTNRILLFGEFHEVEMLCVQTDFWVATYAGQDELSIDELH